MHVLHLLYQYEAEPTYNDNIELSTSLLSIMNILAQYSQRRGQIFFTGAPLSSFYIGCNVLLNP